MEMRAQPIYIVDDTARWLAISSPINQPLVFFIYFFYQPNLPLSHRTGALTNTREQVVDKVQV